VAEKTPEEFARLNEATFTELHDHYLARSYEPRRQRRYARRLARLERRVGRGRLLDVGANAGGFLFAARARGWEGVGVEPVAALAEWARERHGLDVRASTLEQAGLPSASFDLVHSHAVLEHLTDPLAVLREVARVLRPGGCAYLDTVNAESYTARRLGSAWKLIDPALHYCLWSPATLTRAAQAVGLEVVEFRSHGVRLRPNAAGRPTGLARLTDELGKLPWSVAARWTLRGESLAARMQRPRA